MRFEDLLKIQEDLWTYLANTKMPIVMYGTGNGADKIIDVLDSYNIRLSGIFASDDFARGQLFRGFTVKKYSDFADEYSDFIVLVSFASQRTEVLENIYRIAGERELYAPDVPVFGSGLFNLDYFKKHKDKLQKVYDKLSDDISRETFVYSLAFKLTGKISYLIECETNESEVNELIGGMIKNANFVDVGAYTGDTVQKHVDCFGKNVKIYAFEPDEKNYRKMLARFENSGITCTAFNAAAWDKTENLKFCARSGRASSAQDFAEGSKVKEIRALRVDEVVNDHIGLVKIDAEGSDKKVIKGLRRLIESAKPCIKVAAYHKNEDFFSIPEAVSEICENYTLYMRHLRYVPGWDTDFIFKFD